MIHDSFNELIVPIRRFKLFKMSQHFLNSEGEFFGFAIFSFEGSRNLGPVGITQLCPFKLERFNLLPYMYFCPFPWIYILYMPDS